MASKTVPLIQRADPRTKVTPAEAEIIRLRALGMSRKEAAHQLGVSVRALDERMLRAKRRAGISGYGTMLRYALRVGILDIQTFIAGTA